jgi:hypothetical protein
MHNPFNLGTPVIRAFTFAMLFGASMNSSAKEIFIHSHNVASNRYAIFEDNENVAYLYLTEAGTQRPIKDAIAYSRKPLIAKVDWKKIQQTGEVPPLSADIASTQAIVKSPLESEFSFKWSKDGNSVALLRRGQPIAFTSLSEKYGYSKAISKPNPLANPWDQKLYDKLFRNSP